MGYPLQCDTPPGFVRAPPESPHDHFQKDCSGLHWIEKPAELLVSQPQAFVVQEEQLVFAVPEEQLVFVALEEQLVFVVVSEQLVFVVLSEQLLSFVVLSEQLVSVAPKLQVF